MADWKHWVAGICLTAVSCTAFSDSLDEQRQRYNQVRQAWDAKQMDVVAQLMPTLKDYPLYPYLEYRQLSQDLSQDTALGVSNFVNSYPTLPAAKSLRNQFVSELARRDDWQGLLSFSPQEPPTDQAKCNWYYANYATGHQRLAWQGAHSIWMTGRSLPAGCDRLFTAWQSSGDFNADQYLSRVLLAIKAGNDRLTNQLISQLPSDYDTLSRALKVLQNSPQGVLTFAQSVSPTEFSRAVTIFAFNRLARDNADQAQDMIPQLVSAQQMDQQGTQALKEAVAWQLMSTDISAQQQHWRDEVVMDSESETLLERRIRLALSQNDRRGLNTWIARLPIEAKQKDEWQYWQADLLLERGRKAEADDILHQLMKERGFYAMVAAQRLGEPYSLQIDKAPEADSSVTQGPEMARIRELMYWNLDNLARSEWASLIRSKNLTQQQMLASYANSQDWWDLSVQATITAKMWNSLKERFPIAWQTYFQRYASGKLIPTSFAMAISRQESAWNPKIQSPVGASGLMQIMPGTASHMVSMYEISQYSDSSQLLDPEMNIQIGMQYLDYVYRQFDNNRILAAAAYNAGPGRVNRWLGVSQGRLDPVAFIETIPFSETRNYVKNVLSYDVYYRYLMGSPDKIFADSEWNRRY
ncbi:murein transglycosylase [Rosenbergiella australiborealis]|uniref:peptidoglycan lytic exotransglycosylase n=1 Tax=Rosenbergiella australiborealis TaxID=1544696 RepID=A0ABS5T3V6_9GAMM|nr:murein transglycosylase [Rosenbergiella australiborealis]